MIMEPVEGERYTWDEVQKHWNGQQCFLAKKDNRIVCATLDAEKNPEAPEVMIVGHKDMNKARAEEFCKQGDSIPLFIKRKINSWEFKGYFGVESFTTDPELLEKHSVKDEKLSRAIYLEKQRSGGEISLNVNEIEYIHKTLDSLTGVEDVRRLSNVHRQAAFREGWKDSRSRKYTPDTLKRLTWQNLGYRFGEHFGDKDSDWIDQVHQLAHRRWKNEYLLPSDDEEQIQEAVKELLEHQDNLNHDYKGSELPPPETKKTSKSFKRDPQVIAIVKRRAKGICELCGQPAPFEQDKGHPFLEVHHVVPLADGGLDQTSNAVALCPNCHRRCHYAVDRNDATEQLYSNVSELKRPNASLD